jgi:hypothetical protein
MIDISLIESQDFVMYPDDTLLDLLEPVLKSVLAETQSRPAEMLAILDTARFSSPCFLDLPLQNQIWDKLVSKKKSNFVIYEKILLDHCDTVTNISIQIQVCM